MRTPDVRSPGNRRLDAGRRCPSPARRPQRCPAVLLLKEVRPMSTTPDQVLDCVGLVCPMPVLRTKQAIDAPDVGQVLQMTATDTVSPADVKAWTDMTGHELLSSEESGSKFIFLKTKN